MRLNELHVELGQIGHQVSKSTAVVRELRIITAQWLGPVDEEWGLEVVDGA